MDVSLKTGILDISAMPPETKKISIELRPDLSETEDPMVILYMRCYNAKGDKIATARYFKERVEFDVKGRHKVSQP